MPTNFASSTCKKIPKVLTLYAPITQNGQTHSKNSWAFAEELFEFV